MTEAKIKDALIRLHTAIKVSDGPGVSASLTELDNLLAAHGSELDARLHHFLSGRSYAKALTYLGGGDEVPAKPSTPPSGCTGGRA
jgi:hypothetical protein